MRVKALKALVLVGVVGLALVSCEDLNEPVKPVPIPASPETPQDGSIKTPGGPYGNPDSNGNPGQDQNGGTSTIAMGYKTISGSWTSARWYEYLTNGDLKKITWRSETPFVQTGSYQYGYDQNGKLATVTNDHGQVEQYIWENGVVVRKNILSNGFISEYKTYTYNEYGYVANVSDYYLKQEGHYALRGVNEFLYFTDGNLYASMYYIYNANSDSFELNTTKIWDNYIDTPNPFPMLEVIPGVKMQNKLPQSYAVTIGKQKINYWFSYELRSDGYPLSRTTSSEYGNEYTTYQYY